MTYECYYCGQGNIASLPSECLSCHAKLTKLATEMTTQEFGDAIKLNAEVIRELFAAHADMTLAC